MRSLNNLFQKKEKYSFKKSTLVGPYKNMVFKKSTLGGPGKNNLKKTFNIYYLRGPRPGGL